jgi:hypothetical protein
MQEKIIVALFVMDTPLFTLDSINVAFLRALSL